MAKKKATRKPDNSFVKPSGRQSGSRSTGVAPSLDTLQGDPQMISPADLILDPGNLRLLELEDDSIRNTKVSLFGQEPVQEKLMIAITTNPQFGAETLLSSIRHNGYLRHEQLIVARYDGDFYLVLEGNRRLACAKYLLRNFANTLSSPVKRSLETVPCFVLKGDPISGSAERLREYRRASEVYIGLRHLMEAKSWEPASKYEFQARLIQEDGWTIEDVMERFGRTRAMVIRDLKAQTLYHKFRKYEESTARKHKITYNAFAEAARKPRVMNWLGWKDSTMSIADSKATSAFFEYLIQKVDFRDSDSDEDRQNAEVVVKEFNSMLSIEDEDVNDLITKLEFSAAQSLYHERRDGALQKRIEKYVRALSNVSVSEMKENKSQNLKLLEELKQIVDELIEVMKKI
jgi:hypothetical protein